MRITKGDLVNGAHELIRISGLTIDANPSEVKVGLQACDDYAAELKGVGLDINYQDPTDYGLSDPDDNSGLTPESAGPFKKLLALELLAFYGKQIPQSLMLNAQSGRRAIENIAVSVPNSQNPPTLPIGSGNEQDYRSRKFYSEPANNHGADYVYKNDVLTFSHDFSDWLVDETLVSATWVVDDSGIVVSNESLTDAVATAELLFTKVGGYSICITATKTNSNDKFTIKENFIIRDCEDLGLKFS